MDELPVSALIMLLVSSMLCIEFVEVVTFIVFSWSFWLLTSCLLSNITQKLVRRIQEYQNLGEPVKELSMTIVISSGSAV